MPPRVLRHESAIGRYELVEADADPRLNGLVGRYQDFEEHTARPFRRREVAVPHVVVIVDLGSGWDIAGRDDDGFAHHGSFVAGVHDRPTTVRHDGRARCLQVNLTPLGGRALLGVPLSELTNRVVALEDLLGPDARRLEERLHEAADRRQRFAALDSVLLERAALAEPVRADVTWAWRRLVHSGGGVPIGSLAAELGCSRRHLSGRFGHEIGLPPKSYGRLLRFRRANDALVGGGEQGLARVAAACGYSDQSHLNRDFRAFAGTTPAALLASRVPGGGGVST